MQNGSNTLTCYLNTFWWSGVSRPKNTPVIAENINLFRVWCTGARNDTAGNADYWYDVPDYNTSDSSPYMSVRRTAAGISEYG